HVPTANPDWNGNNPDPASSYCPWRVYNIGNNNKEQLMRYIEVLEDCLGKKARKNFLPMQDGDVPATYANVDDLVREIDFKPDTSIEEGIRNFVDWYREYYRY
ncbi:MAG: capsular biosynthesis protein CpsI, partial [Desulfobulbaceae bacterium]|nr:capsular biosynthesis protein CpsI [Desulfobulbaceae bacterium]